MISVRCITTSGDLEALLPAWRALELAAGNTLPFLTADWNACWWRHFALVTFGARDALSVRALHAPDGRLVAVAPLMLTSRPGLSPVCVRYLQFLGADMNLTELRGMLCLPGWEARAYGALLRELRQERGWDWLELSGVRVGCEGEAVILGAGACTRTIPSYVLRLAPSWEELRGRLKPNIKESLRKCYNSLKRDGHAFTFDVARSPGEVRAALGDFLVLHGARAALEGTVVHKNRFVTARSQAFLFDVCTRLAERGAARVFTLRIGGRPVAQRIGFVLGGSLYLYYSGYDPAWGRYSVMTTTVAETLKAAIAEGLQAVNLSTGNDVSKTRWGPEEVLHREFLHLGPAPYAPLLHSAYRTAVRSLRHSALEALVSRSGAT